tara:strand:- start:555 stop:716 length:162 start_codon:yes stop_codon:yes gene_type:complete
MIVGRKKSIYSVNQLVDKKYASQKKLNPEIIVCFFHKRFEKSKKKHILRQPIG